MTLVARVIKAQYLLLSSTFISDDLPCRRYINEGIVFRLSLLTSLQIGLLKIQHAHVFMVEPCNGHSESMRQ